MKIMPKKLRSNGNRRPIRYENWNGAKAIRYDENIVLFAQEISKELIVLCIDYDVS